MNDNHINPDNAGDTVQPVQPIQSVQPQIPETQPSSMQSQPIQPSVLPNQEHDTGTRTIVTVLVLLLAYPIGILLMWFWTKWPKWIKLLITLPIVLAIIGIVLALFLATFDPFKTLSSAQDRNYELTTQEFSIALQSYYTLHQNLPWTGNPPCSNKPTGSETIADLKPCVNLIINDGILKGGFITTSYINSIYVSDNSIPGTIKTSVCFLPIVQTTTAKYTKDGQTCLTPTGCYICSFNEFTEIPKIVPTKIIQSNNPTTPASASGNVPLK